MSWKSILDQWSKNGLLNEENPIIVDYLLKFEATAPLLNRSSSPLIDSNMSPVMGVQVGLVKEYEQTILTVNHENEINLNSHKTIDSEQVLEAEQIRKSPVPSASNDIASSLFGMQTTAIKAKKATSDSQMHSNHHQIIPNNFLSEEIQLKAVYELQIWKEAREKEFEQEVIISIVLKLKPN